MARGELELVPGISRHCTSSSDKGVIWEEQSREEPLGLGERGRESDPGRGNSPRKGLMAGACLVSSRNKEACVAGVE